jgi:uracil-DNA glycosylase family 4
MTSHQFDELCNKVRFCTRCPRMDDSARVLSRAAGPLDADIMFIGEAPGRLGADASEIPFHGDKAGHNFEELLAFAGLDRSRIFVTNAALCNPKADNGNNATPSREEVQNCSSYLRTQIELVNPSVVVTLGAVALGAVRLVAPHELDLASSVRTSHPWFGRTLVPLYHPGMRAMIHRSMANQRSDYQYVAERLSHLSSRRRKSSGATKNSVADLARLLIRSRGATSYFALHKLMYLVEWYAWTKRGEPLTNAYFIRQKDGPYCTDLHLAKLRRALVDLVVEGPMERPTLRVAQGLFEQAPVSALPADTAEIVNDVLTSTDGLSDAELKTKVYMSAPMRALLRAERTQLLNLYNAPIRFDVLSPRAQSAEA